ncbi:hypothetical protein BGZ54_002423, partial [Gamsiella multidivaricata]
LEKDSVDHEKSAAEPPSAAQTPARNFKLASLVDRVRLAQQQGQEHQQPASPTETGYHLNNRPHLSPSHPSDPTQHPSEKAAVDRLRQSRPEGSTPTRPSSSIRNGVGDLEHGQPHDHHTHHRNDVTGDAPHPHLFPKIFNKENVRNALFLNSATTAFAKSNRSKSLGNVDIPVASLAVTGLAVPALWLRRDDKGRRSPPVIFQMLKLAVADSEINLNFSKQILFRVELQYGDVKWVIRRTMYDFYKLHLSLATKRFDNLPKFPGHLSDAFAMVKASFGMKTEERTNYLRRTNLARRQAFQNYLLQVLQQLCWTIAYDLYEFLEISAMSITKDMGWKGKEAYVDTKITDSTNAICGCNGYSPWRKNWALLRDSYLAFCSNIGSNEPTEVFIFDQTFFVQHKEQHMGLNMHHIEVGNRHRRIEIKGDHNREMREWMDHFNMMKQSSPWVTSHRFGSFAPQREDVKVRYYVDGKNYFHAISDAILAAKNEIYICDWWLSPELYLRRPPEKNEEFRLDRLLKRKAMEGVMIYIVVYKEISLALTLDSAHTKIWLQNLHPNIQVQRHPDHLGVKTTQFWAHHEKICVIDCRLAFIGGLDMCFGRYDSRTHQLSDYHPSGKGTIWPGQDYSNPRIKDFVNVKDYNSDLIEKKLLARMPWHDVSLGVVGQPARDIARHFVQRWNLVKREKGMKKTHMKFLTPKGEFVSTRNESGWTGTQKVQILRSSTIWSQGVDLEQSIQAAYLACIQSAEHFIYIENQFFVTLATENGNPDIKNKIGIALVERILKAHSEGKKFRVIVIMPLMPAFEADIMSSEAGTLRKVMHFQYVSICRGGNSVLERLIASGVDPDQYIGFFGLRSFDRIKHGKFDAIVEAVKEAEQQQRDKQRGQADSGQQGRAQGQGDSNQDTKSLPSRGNNKSLASKYLLEPIPKGEAAARIKAVADDRKGLDMLKTWDESITKRAMNQAIMEHGYVPAATDNSLADERLNTEIQRDTRQAEKTEAANQPYRKSGRTSPELKDGFGTRMRDKLERKKGDKDRGDVEPRHHRMARKSRLQRLRHPLHHDSDEDSDDSVQEEDIAETRGYETDISPEVRSTRDSESIVEPIPGASAAAANQEGMARPQGPTGPDSEEVADPMEHPTADIPAPVHVEEPTVDNEVDDFVTEQLYIHSKLMIIDDRIIICGSANINDRSQVGFRDSEIAIIIEDTEMVPSRMNGEPYQAGKLAHTLRADLFKEHLGLLPHVEHDVVTEASVLPVDLDSPSKDPEQTRQELIRKANEEQQAQQEQRSQLHPTQAIDSEIVSLEENTIHREHGYGHGHGLDHGHGPEGGQDQGQRRHHRFNDRRGRVQVYMPNEEETQATDQWRSPHSTGQAKKRAADDPEAAHQIVTDPLHDDFYEGWWKRVAKTNTEIFREVFRCVPDNTVETWDDYRDFVPNPKKVLIGHVAMEGATVEDVTERLQKVTGHLVEFPINFLNKENLMGGAVEGVVVPMEIFT